MRSDIASRSQIARCLALTCSSCGLQIFWSILMSSGTPFLLSLGYSGASTAIVWSIGPLCGTFVQPWFGKLSDRHRREGRSRQHLLLGGAIASCVSLVAFSLSRTLVIWSARSCGLQIAEAFLGSCSRTFAALCFLVLNVAIQPFQMAGRAIIIESNDPSVQILMSTWATRVQGVGSIIGFLLGSLRISRLLPTGFASDFPVLCVLGSLAVLVTSCVSARAAGSRPPISVEVYDDPSTLDEPSPGLLKLLTCMPRELGEIFAIQFFSWLGWFPFRTYYTSWLADLDDAVQVSSTAIEIDALQANAAHTGSVAGFWLSVVALTVNCAIPPCVEFICSSTTTQDKTAMELHAPTWTPTQVMLRLWIGSHLLSACAAFAAGFVSSQAGAVLLVASLGVAWAMTLWVPYSLVGLVLSRQAEGSTVEGAPADQDGVPPQMGAVVGLHNAAISAPQIISAIMCSIVFGTSRDEMPRALIVMLSGGCWTLVAACVMAVFLRDLQRL